MTSKFPVTIIAALLFGLLVGGSTTYLLLDELAHRTGGHIHDESDSHDYGLGTEGFHVHADFLVVANGEKIDLTDDKYMSVAKRVLHPGVHLHDNKDNIIHFHAPSISLVEFIESISLSLTPECLTVEEEKFCTNDTSVLRLYVNEVDRTAEISTYEPQDNDRVLLYYGDPTESVIAPWLEAVTDRACIYTGTCPERGTAPAEECGLTCEL